MTIGHSAWTATSDLTDVPFELASLAGATRYQQWIYRTVSPFLGDRILEVGAGIGNLSKWLPIRERLILSETDAKLLGHLKRNLEGLSALDSAKVSATSFDIIKDDASGFVNENLDTVVSFNVLEHIEDDILALESLSRLVRNSKSNHPRRVVTFVPAHSWAYGGMDRTFGHYRRYSKSGLAEICRKVAPEAKLTLRHFNTVGLAGWVWNGRVLGKTKIGSGALAAFEKICPIVSPIDDFIHEKLKFPLGQSLLAVMEWT